MMAVKLLAVCLILGSCTLLGFGLADRLKRQAETIGQLRHVLNTLSNEISFSLSPLPDVLRRVSKEDLGMVSDFAACVARELAQGGSFREAWLSALEQYRRRLGISERTVQILQNLGHSLGTLSRELEVGNIHIALGALKEEEQRVRARYDKDAKMYRSLSIMAGILIVVIFL